MANELPAAEHTIAPESFDLEAIIKILPEGEFDDSTRTAESDRPETQQDQQPEQQSGEGSQEDGSQKSPEPLKPINKAALALALFGWDTISFGTAGLVGCGACFRRLGLWMYKPKDNGDTTVYDTLDVAHEHMEYCPWVSGKAQSGTGKPNEKQAELRSGWELLVQALRVKHRRQIRSIASRETLRAVSETPTDDFPAVDDASEEHKKASDREWWAKLRRMRQVLNVKSPQRKKSVAP